MICLNIWNNGLEFHGLANSGINGRIGLVKFAVRRAEFEALISRN